MGTMTRDLMMDYMEERYQPDDLVLSVSDDGCGIPAENLEKVFLPFFTTKADGHGTGLGLSTVHGIVEGLGGQIRVSSEVEAGTVFTVHLPLEPAEDREVLAASA